MTTFESLPVLQIAIVSIPGLVSLLLWALTAFGTSRSERIRRQREEFAKALSVCIAYEEFPYIVRRRRRDAPDDERIRISTMLSEVQKSIGYYSAWLAIESPPVSLAYQDFVTKLRQIAGAQIKTAWTLTPIESDQEMNMPDLGLAELKSYKESYLIAASDHLSVFPAFMRRIMRKIIHSG